MSGGLRYQDMPALYQTADGSALRAQSRFLWSIKGQIWSLLIGASGSSIASLAKLDAIAFVAVAAFTAAAGLRVHLRISRVEATWYDARLVAESVKSLAWRYAMGAHPFPIQPGGEEEVNRAFQARVWDTLSEVDTDVIPAKPDPSAQVSPRMLDTRSLPLDERRSLYETARIQDQIAWYSGRSQRNAARARRWDVAFLAASVVAIAFGIFQVVGVVDVSLLNIGGYSAALIATWTGVNRFERLAKSYGVAAHELVAMRAEMQTIDDPDEWAEFVNQAEEAISTEHTSWRVARRG